MARSGRNAGPRFDVPDDVQVKVLGEIGERVVVRDQLASLVGRHGGFPFLLGSAEPLVEILKPLLEIGHVGWIQLAKLLRQATGNAAAIVRVQPVVRVSKWVHVAHRAGHWTRGYVEDLGELRSIEISLGPDLNARVPALRDERRQPPNLELQAHRDQQICLAQLEQEAWLGLNEMWV